MKKGLPASELNKMVGALKAGETISKTASRFNVSKEYVETFAKFYRDKGGLKKAPKD